MELKAHFSNIHKVIIHHLEQAQTELAAIAESFPPARFTVKFAPTLQWGLHGG
jgi:hypothetical protein